MYNSYSSALRRSGIDTSWALKEKAKRMPGNPKQPGNTNGSPSSNRQTGNTTGSGSNTGPTNPIGGNTNGNGVGNMYNQPLPPGQRAPDVQFPTMPPPDDNMRLSHLTGRYARQMVNGQPTSKPIWKNYFRPLAFDQLPANLTTMDDEQHKEHWANRIVLGGTKIVLPCGTKVSDYTPSPKGPPRHPLQYGPATTTPPFYTYVMMLVYV